VTDSAEALERRIDELRTAVRRAVTVGDRHRARTLRGELRRTEQEWDEALDELAEQALQQAATPQAAPRSPRQSHAPRRSAEASPPQQRGGPLLPLREQVHQALTLLAAPAAPRLVIAVHQAFSVGDMVSARLTSLRRDEERSFRSAPHARPYYLCSALTADLLAPARGLLAVSTWPMARRIIGPLSPRVDFLTAAIRLAEHVQRLTEPTPAATRLLWRFAANIPGAAADADTMAATAVAAAARAELDIHAEADAAHRAAAARRAIERLDEAEQLFGSRLRLVSATGT